MTHSFKDKREHSIKKPKPDESKMLSKKVRFIIGLLSLPSLMLAAMLIKTAMNEQFETIGAFELLYALVGVIAAYIALTGKRFFKCWFTETYTHYSRIQFMKLNSIQISKVSGE